MSLFDQPQGQRPGSSKNNSLSIITVNCTSDFPNLTCRSSIYNNIIKGLWTFSDADVWHSAHKTSVSSRGIGLQRKVTRRKYTAFLDKNVHV